MKDQALLEYLKEPVRFADLINGTLFCGKQIIDPGYLKKMKRKSRLLLAHDSQGTTDEGKKAEHTSEKNAKVEVNRSMENTWKNMSGPEKGNVETQAEYLERERDMLMLHNKPEGRCLLGCEGQSEADYNMPVRNLCYDSIEYAEQARTGKYRGKNKEGKKSILLPVLNVVLYLGEKRWKSGHDLQEMMQIPDVLEEYRKWICDCHVYVADIHEQAPELFCTEWREIFRLMKHSRKKEELKAYIENHKREIRQLSMDTRIFLGALLDQYDILEDNQVEVKDVCQAWDGAMLMYRDEGKTEGLREGLREGMKNGIKEGKRKVAENMYHRGYSAEDTSGLTEEPLEVVQAWYREFSEKRW